MKDLQQVRPTPEQLKLITIPTPGVRVIRGAAGSGKTTTAILMLRTAIGYLLDIYRETSGSPAINVKVFSFNRTLKSYISKLVNETSIVKGSQVSELNIEVTTLSRYLQDRLLSPQKLIHQENKKAYIREWGRNINLENDFLIDEVEYVLGRLPHNNLESYMTMERTGRGNSPRVDSILRRKILDEVIYPYIEYKKNMLLLDWDDLAERGSHYAMESIDIAIIDEAQDFSANQLRSIIKQLSPNSFTVIILDSAQKIYKRGFTWKDVGISNLTSYRLERNYRNTAQIADFANKFIENSGILFDDDATLSDVKTINKVGCKPKIVQGSFSQQMDYIIAYIKSNIDLECYSVGFLHPKGGGWFDYVKSRLLNADIQFIEISRTNDWPKSDTNVALSTIHSAKGLEFDYVFLVGLEDKHFNIDENDHDNTNYSSTIRLIAMGITRAKEDVIVSYSSDREPLFMKLFDKGTYEGHSYVH